MNDQTKPTLWKAWEEVVYKAADKIADAVKIAAPASAVKPAGNLVTQPASAIALPVTKTRPEPAPYPAKAKRVRSNRFMVTIAEPLVEPVKAKIKSSGLTPSKFWEAAALCLHVPPSVDGHDFDRLRYQVVKQGSNLRQVTCKMYETGDAPARAEIQRLTASYDRLAGMLEELIRK